MSVDSGYSSQKSLKMESQCDKISKVIFSNNITGYNILNHQINIERDINEWRRVIQYMLSDIPESLKYELFITLGSLEGKYMYEEIKDISKSEIYRGSNLMVSTSSGILILDSKCLYNKMKDSTISDCDEYIEWLTNNLPYSLTKTMICSSTIVPHMMIKSILKTQNVNMYKYIPNLLKESRCIESSLGKNISYHKEIIFNQNHWMLLSDMLKNYYNTKELDILDTHCTKSTMIYKADDTSLHINSVINSSESLLYVVRYNLKILTKGIYGRIIDDTLLKETGSFITGRPMSMILRLFIDSYDDDPYEENATHNMNNNTDIFIICPYSDVESFLTGVTLRCTIENELLSNEHVKVELWKCVIMRPDEMSDSSFCDIIIYTPTGSVRVKIFIAKQYRGEISKKNILRTLVWGFHLDCVRAWYDGDDFNFFPSYITAIQTSTCYELRYTWKPEKLLSIIIKYRSLGYNIAVINTFKKVIDFILDNQSL